MAGHGRRWPTSVNEQTNDPGFTFPLSSQGFYRWRRFFTSIPPFVSRTTERTLSVYARRLLNDNANIPLQENGPQVHTTPIGERNNIMGTWSLNRVQLGSGRYAASGVSSNENFDSSPSDESNIVINIESNTPREHQHPQLRRSASPVLNNSMDSMHHSLPLAGINDSFDPGLEDSNSLNYGNDSLTESSPSSFGNDSLAENNQSTENGHSLSINGESLSDILDRYPELKNVLKVIVQYCIFVLIIAIKTIYDRFASLLIIITFLAGFLLSNEVVMQSVLHQESRSKRLTFGLYAALVCIPLGIYQFYHRSSTNLYYSAMLLPSDSHFLSLGELIWVIIITDFVLKLSSVFIKGIYALLPSFLLHYVHRGKHLAMIEFTSQLYRSIAPVQPWISYLLDNYTGIQKVFGVFLSALYMLCKGPDIIRKAKNFNFVLRKFLQNSKYGSAPSNAQLKDVGMVCPICQDDFVLPTMLQCKHIFCERCVARWFDRERTCPLCRTKIADDPSYRDGATTYSIQLF